VWAAVSFCTGAVAGVSTGATAPVSSAALLQPSAVVAPRIIATATIILPLSFMVVVLPRRPGPRRGRGGPRVLVVGSEGGLSNGRANSERPPRPAVSPEIRGGAGVTPRSSA